MKHNIEYILYEGFPDRQWSIVDGKFESIIYHDNLPAITMEQVLAADESLRSKDYLLNRKGKYPSMTDQLDMLWHAMDNGEIPKAIDFYNAIKMIKDGNPK